MARKKKAVPTGEIKPMRRNTETGELAPPARGRPTGDWVRGYVDAEGTFHEGDVPKKRGKRGRKPGRPKGSTNKKSAKAVKGGALSAQRCWALGKGRFRRDRGVKRVHRGLVRNSERVAKRIHEARERRPAPC